MTTSPQPIPELEPDTPVAPALDGPYADAIAALEQWAADLRGPIMAADARVAAAVRDLADAEKAAARHRAKRDSHLAALAVLRGEA